MPPKCAQTPRSRAASRTRKKSATPALDVPVVLDVPATRLSPTRRSASVVQPSIESSPSPRRATRSIAAMQPTVHSVDSMSEEMGAKNTRPSPISDESSMGSGLWTTSYVPKYSRQDDPDRSTSREILGLGFGGRLLPDDRAYSQTDSRLSDESIHVPTENIQHLLDDPHDSESDKESFPVPRGLHETLNQMQYRAFIASSPSRQFLDAYDRYKNSPQFAEASSSLRNRSRPDNHNSSSSRTAGLRNSANHLTGRSSAIPDGTIDRLSPQRTFQSQIATHYGGKAAQQPAVVAQPQNSAGNTKPKGFENPQRSSVPQARQHGTSSLKANNRQSRDRRPLHIPYPEPGHRVSLPYKSIYLAPMIYFNHENTVESRTRRLVFKLMISFVLAIWYMQFETCSVLEPICKVHPWHTILLLRFTSEPIWTIGWSTGYTGFAVLICNLVLRLVSVTKYFLGYGVACPETIYGEYISSERSKDADIQPDRALWFLTPLNHTSVILLTDLSVSVTSIVSTTYLAEFLSKKTRLDPKGPWALVCSVLTIRSVRALYGLYVSRKLQVTYQDSIPNTTASSDLPREAEAHEANPRSSSLTRSRANPCLPFGLKGITMTDPTALKTYASRKLRLTIYSSLISLLISILILTYSPATRSSIHGTSTSVATHVLPTFISKSLSLGHGEEGTWHIEVDRNGRETRVVSIGTSTETATVMERMIVYETLSP